MVLLERKYSTYIIKTIVEECSERPSYYRRDDMYSKFDKDTYMDIRYIVTFINGHESVYRKLHNILIDNK